MEETEVPTVVLVEEDREPIIDRVLGKLISRKFTVFLTATGLMLWSTLDPDTWGMVAIVYIGSQGVIDAAVSWKHGKQ